MNAGLDNKVYTQNLCFNFVEENIFAYNQSTEGPMPKGINATVIPFKMSSGCGRAACEDCKYVAKSLKLNLDKTVLEEYINYIHKNIYSNDKKILLLVTDEITNLPTFEVAEVMTMARDKGFLLEYANTVNLAKVSNYTPSEFKSIFGDYNNPCMGVCTNITLKALDGQSDYTAHVFDGLEKLLNQKPYKISMNLTIGRHYPDVGAIKKLFSEILRPLKERTRNKNVGMIFRAYYVNNPSFFLAGESKEQGYIQNEMVQLNEGGILDVDGQYRYLF